MCQYTTYYGTSGGVRCTTCSGHMVQKELATIDVDQTTDRSDVPSCVLYQRNASNGCALIASQGKKHARPRVDWLTTLFFFFLHTFCTFQLLNKPWSQVSSLLPPGSCLQFLSRIGFSNSTLLADFSSSVANSRFRAFRKSTCAQEKFPTNLYEYALGGI